MLGTGIAKPSKGRILLASGLAMICSFIVIYHNGWAGTDESPASRVEFRGIEERIAFVQKLPEAPSKLSRSSESLLVVNKVRNQVYLGTIGLHSFEKIGGFGRQEGEYENVTDAGFSPFDDQIYVLDQANQRLTFYSRSGEFTKSIPFGFTTFPHFRTTVFGALATEQEILLVGAANEKRPLQIHRLSWEGRYLSSFFRLPDQFHDKNLSGFGVPFVRAHGGRILVGLKVDHVIRQFEYGGKPVAEIGAQPAFYRPPTRKPKDLSHGSEEFWQWFRSWNSLVDLIPFDGGLLQVFYLHDFPRYAIAFLSTEGASIRSPVRTDLQPFDVYEGRLMLFSDTGVYSAEISE